MGVTYTYNCDVCEADMGENPAVAIEVRAPAYPTLLSSRRDFQRRELYCSWPCAEMGFARAMAKGTSEEVAA